MPSATRSLSAAVLSAAAMYWLDPSSGRRRRARLKDQLGSALRGARHTLDVGARDLGHRMEGVAAQVRYRFSDGSVDDSVLAERVRACLGRAVSHPGAIEAEIARGRVTLKGDVLAQEYPRLMRCVRGVRGVCGVEDQLGVHSDARGVSALQGGRPRSARRLDLFRESWAPSTRLLIGGAGGALALAGLRRGGALGALGMLAGSLSIVRAATNMPLRRLAGGNGRRAIDIRKTIHIQAPVERVFETLSRFEEYPLFLHNVRNVRMHADGRSHWTVVGPAGTAVEWDSEASEVEPRRLIAWRTVRNSPIQHAGIMRFEPSSGGGTRIDIRMSYNPPGGALGHVVASLFGSDPKNQLDEAGIRLKSFIETGKAPRDAARHAAPNGAAAAGASGKHPEPAPKPRSTRARSRAPAEATREGLDPPANGV